MTQSAKTTFWEEIKMRLELWEEHLKDPTVALDKALKCVERISIKADYRLKTFCGIGLQWPVAEGAQAWCQRCGTNLKVFSLIWTPGTACVRAQPLHALECPKKYGPHCELFFFFHKKEPMVPSELVNFGSCVSTETVKACALNGLHMMAEENAFRSDSDLSPDLGDIWRYGCPKSSVWSNEWAGSEDASSLEDYEQNVDNLAIEFVGQNGSTEVISHFLYDLEVGREALSYHFSIDL